MSDLRDALILAKSWMQKLSGGYNGAGYGNREYHDAIGRIDAALSAQPQPEAVEAVKPLFAHAVIAACQAYMPTYDALHDEIKLDMQTRMRDALLAAEKTGALNAAPPLAPDARMHLDDELAGCREALKKAVIKSAKDDAKISDLNDMVLRYMQRAERAQRALEYIVSQQWSGNADLDDICTIAEKALSGAADASNASAEARLLTGSLAKDVAAAAKRVSEWSAAKQDYARRAMGAGADGKEFEGGEDPFVHGAEDEAYALGRRDGYESAIQDIDIATGGDGEFKGSTIPGEAVDVPAMRARIIARCRAASDPTTAEQREAIARIIDPGGWRTYDHWVAYEPTGVPKDDESRRKHLAPSLEKADRILALSTRAGG